MAAVKAEEHPHDTRTVRAAHGVTRDAFFSSVFDIETVAKVRIHNNLVMVVFESRLKVGVRHLAFPFLKIFQHHQHCGAMTRGNHGPASLVLEPKKLLEFHSNGLVFLLLFKEGLDEQILNLTPEFRCWWFTASHQIRQLDVHFCFLERRPCFPFKLLNPRIVLASVQQNVFPLLHLLFN